MINLKTVLTVAALFQVATCVASDSWKQLTSASKLTCEIAKPCIIQQAKGHPKFEIVLRSTTPNASDMFWVEEFQIRDTSNGKSSMSRLADNDGVDTMSEVPLFSHDINEDGFVDLILEKGNYNHGQAFFYWIYNPLRKQFVFQGNGNIPELKKVSGSLDTFESTTSYERFKLDSSFLLQKQP